MYNIVKYGAVSGIGNMNTKAIQNAIDDCAAHGGGRVTVPSGSFVTGTIYLKSNVELHLEMGAELKASLDRADFNTLDAYPENWFAPLEGWDGRHLIIAHRQENVAITGFGRINGSADDIFIPTVYEGYDFMPVIWSYGLQYQEGFHYGMTEAENPRPGQTVVFVDCKDIHISDITIINAPSWCLFLHGCENVQIRGYKSFNKRAWANTDGIDIDTCRNVTVSDCIIDTGDDAIAIRCDSAHLNNGMTACEGISITNCVFASSSSVFRIGVGAGEIHNIIISNIVIRRGGVAFTLATHFSEECHGLIEDIMISNIVADNTSKPFELHAKKDCYIRNISFRNYQAKCFRGATIIASDSAEVSNISVNDMHLTIVPSPFARPILSEDGGNCLFYAENAEKVRFDNTTADIPSDLKKLFTDELYTITDTRK